VRYGEEKNLFPNHYTNYATQVHNFQEETNQLHKPEIESNHNSSKSRFWPNHYKGKIHPRTGYEGQEGK